MGVEFVDPSGFFHLARKATMRWKVFAGKGRQEPIEHSESKHERPTSHRISITLTKNPV